MLLLWVLLIPNAFSFGLIAFALLDLLSTRTLDRCFTRKSIVETLERAGASTGAIETLLESLYERCVLVPSLFLRQLTLFYCFLLQIHSFCRSVRFSYGVSDPRWLFALFGGHGEASSVRDRYVQIVLFIVLYGFLRVALNPSLLISLVLQSFQRAERAAAASSLHSRQLAPLRPLHHAPDLPQFRRGDRSLRAVRRAFHHRRLRHRDSLRRRAPRRVDPANPPRNASRRRSAALPALPRGSFNAAAGLRAGCVGREVAVEGERSDVRFLAAGWKRADSVRSVRVDFVFVRVRSLFVDHTEVF